MGRGVVLPPCSFVSILARPEGRALRIALTLQRWFELVSILARPEGRALPRAMRRCPRPSKFQSSPAPKDGRYVSPEFARQVVEVVSILARPEGRALRAGFCVYHSRQCVSILARPEGRALPDQVAVHAGEGEVSILARPEGRALLSPTVDTEQYTLFQSSPAPKDGRYGRYDRDALVSVVSILARPEGRALLVMAGACASGIGFNPRPPRRTGATKRMTWHGCNGSFQSSPAPKDGRYCHYSRCWRSPHRFNPRPPRRTGATRAPTAPPSADRGFNPRPPRRTGATVSKVVKQLVDRVSILARPEGRALHQATGLGGLTDSFQSSPAPKDGRYAAPAAIAAHRASFNPRPPRRTGATGRGGGEREIAIVSILARPEGRALR